MTVGAAVFLHRNPPTRARGIGGGVRRQASIEGVRFRCRLQAAYRLYSPLTHRNLWHAGRRLKRAFRFRKFFGYFLPKKVTTRKPVLKTAPCLRHGVGRDAPGLCSTVGMPRVRRPEGGAAVWRQCRALFSEAPKRKCSPKGADGATKCLAPERPYLKAVA
jgi:hypothetical protein